MKKKIFINIDKFEILKNWKILLYNIVIYNYVRYQIVSVMILYHSII